MAGVHPREYLRKDRGEGVQTVKMLRSLPHCIGGVREKNIGVTL
jgi:hypothetical protein